MRKGMLIVLFSLLVATVFAGPFGIEMGWTLEDLTKNGITYVQVKKEYNISTYTIQPVSSHPNFKTYYVLVDDIKGIFKIAAFGKDISTSKYGTDLKNEYSAIKKQISSMYGEPEEFDFLRSGSIWDDSGDWMMSLKLGERYLTAFWDMGGKNDLFTILLDTKATSTSDGHLVLYYESPEIDEIMERKQKSSSAVF